MAESFANLDNILHEWGKDKYKKCIVEALNRHEKHMFGDVAEPSVTARRVIARSFTF